MQSTSSAPLLPDPLEPGVVEPMGQADLFKRTLYKKKKKKKKRKQKTKNKEKTLKKQQHKKCNYEHAVIVIPKSLSEI